MKIFRDYDAWHRKTHGEPGLALHPVPAKTLPAFAKRHDVPAAYIKLLATLGAGAIRCGDHDDYTLLRPNQVERARRDCASWLDDDAKARARKNQRVDVTTMVPFLVMPDWTTWVVFAGNRVFYVCHDWELREDVDLFAGPLTFAAFFEQFFARARKGDPLNGSYAHRFSFRR